MGKLQVMNNSKPTNIKELYWRSKDLKPKDAGSYLVVIKGNNSLDYSSDEAHSAEFDFWSDTP